MKWTSFEDIGIALVEKFPGVDPLTAAAVGVSRVCIRPPSTAAAVIPADNFRQALHLLFCMLRPLFVA